MEEKQSARETAIQYFLQEIRSGNLKSGDKILNERQLAEFRSEKQSAHCQHLEF